MDISRHARAPLFEALVRHAEMSRGWFHVPGHRGGPGFDPRARHWFAPLLRLDLTELPGLDDLHQPEGVIAEAQRLAAEAFGAEETYFLVGGSTVVQAPALGQAEERPLHRLALIAKRQIGKIGDEQVELQRVAGDQPHTAVGLFGRALPAAASLIHKPLP